jgi:hypothetical protein
LISLPIWIFFSDRNKNWFSHFFETIWGNMAIDVPNPTPGKLITDQTTFQVACQIPYILAMPGTEPGESGGWQILRDARVVEAKW